MANTAGMTKLAILLLVTAWLAGCSDSDQGDPVYTCGLKMFSEEEHIAGQVYRGDKAVSGAEVTASSPNGTTYGPETTDNKGCFVIDVDVGQIDLEIREDGDEAYVTCQLAQHQTKHLLVHLEGSSTCEQPPTS